MAGWEEFRASEPGFADDVRARFDAGVHKVLATLRRDGSPRVSGTEVTFAGGHLWLGMMPGSRKLQDLRRDPRLALHSASPDPEEGAGEWAGDAKLSGRGIEVTDTEQLRMMLAASGNEVEVDSSVFSAMRVDITEVVRTFVTDGTLVIEHWRPGRQLTRTHRE